MKNRLLFFKRSGFIFLSFFMLLTAANWVFAAGTTDVGLNTVQSAGIVLSNTSPIVIITRIIQIILSFLSLIAVVIIIYAGFIWTTSGGNQEKISSAKKLLKNAVVGLLIILSAWGIVTFVINKILGNNSASLFNVSDVSLSPPVITQSLGIGALGSCVANDVAPTPGQSNVSRNTAILVTFKTAVEPDTICVKADKTPCACNSTDCNLVNTNNIKVYKTADGIGSPIPLLVTLDPANKILMLKPTTFLGSADGNTEYAVHISNAVKNSSGTGMFDNCKTNYLEWTFETNNQLDLTPPQILVDGLFPPFDSAADTSTVTTSSSYAQASITVSSSVKPNIYQDATTTSVTPVGSSVSASATVNPGYNGAITNFTVSIPAGAVGQAQLFSGQTSLGAFNINNNQVTFPGYFTFTFKGDVVAGNQWLVVISPKVNADELTVGNATYVFTASSTAANAINLPDNYSNVALAVAIVVKLSGNNQIINFSSNGNVVNLQAATVGAAGNSIAFSTTNPKALILKGFSGGQDKQTLYKINDKQDKPMNSVIQVNFNKPINPMTVVGTSDEVYKTVAVVNANLTPSVCQASNSCFAGNLCSKDSDCLSYDCQAGICVGNYVAGNFSLSNSYRTLEFVSNRTCGVNSCGDTMYCLPPNSHLAVEIMAPRLAALCTTSADCNVYAPYTTCQKLGLYGDMTAVLPVSACYDNSQKAFYPLANINYSGVSDISLNSLDGNRDGTAEGPDMTVWPFYIEGGNNPAQRDGFSFSFFINDMINSNPPSISTANPDQNDSDITPSTPIKIVFNDLMMNSTLLTGSVMIGTIEHQLVNLISSSNSSLGYWLQSSNQPYYKNSTEPDSTEMLIYHSDFFDSMKYMSQIGSGVKDIYQNCFKPSTGPACQINGSGGTVISTVTEGSPSCCFGTSTSDIGSNGSCILPQ